MALSANSVLLDVNGVGYDVIVTNSAFNRLQQNKEGAIFTYLSVSEQGITLYGFDSLEEKEMFLKLISVSGIGAKMGVQILSNVSLSALAIAIATSDVKTLSSIKGCGKKTAERIIVELREKMEIDKSDDKSLFGGNISLSDNSLFNDTCLALATLGFSKAESAAAVEKALQQNPTTIEQAITLSIKLLGR